jgi:hypothetical protein
MKKVMTTIRQSLLLVPAFALAISFAVVPAAYAADLNIQGGANSARGDNTPTDLFGNGGMFQTITNVLLFIIGAIAVIMLIVGGIRYTVSAGDSNAITSAKNTILYAIVGIVVAILAYAVVNWVIGSFAGAA